MSVNIKSAYSHTEIETLLNSLLVDVTTLRTFLTLLTGSATYDAASLVDGAGTTTTITVTGAVLGDFCLVSFGLDVQGISVTGYVSAADTVSVRVQNESAGTLDLASTTIRAIVLPKASFGAALPAINTVNS